MYKCLIFGKTFDIVLSFMEVLYHKWKQIEEMSLYVATTVHIVASLALIINF